jgi:hypothetical protein
LPAGFLGAIRNAAEEIAAGFAWLLDRDADPDGHAGPHCESADRAPNVLGKGHCGDTGEAGQHGGQKGGAVASDQAPVAHEFGRAPGCADE